VDTVELMKIPVNHELTVFKTEFKKSKTPIYKNMLKPGQSTQSVWMSKSKPVYLKEISLDNILIGQ